MPVTHTGKMPVTHTGKMPVPHTAHRQDACYTHRQDACSTHSTQARCLLHTQARCLFHTQARCLFHTQHTGKMAVPHTAKMPVPQQMNFLWGVGVGDAGPELLRCQSCQRLARNPANPPVGHHISTDTLVKSDRQFIPIQNAPFQTPAAPFYCQLG